MSKESILEIIKLLSVLESWSFQNKATYPDYIKVSLATVMDDLTQELLK